MDKKEMCVLDLKNKIDSIANDIGCDGEGIASHNIRSSVSAYCDELGQWFEIVDIELDRLPGCSCSCGLTINLKKDDL